MENLLDLKNKITSFMRIRGPCLPVQIAREIEKSSIIASAFLSELASEKTIKISNMKVGGSPLYFLPGQEALLEKFSQHLPGKEKEALIMLKENKILQDEKLDPSIRVALRSIKDFAFPIAFNYQSKPLVFWRYLTFQEQEAKTKIQERMIKPIQTQPQIQPEPEIIAPQIKTIQIQPQTQTPSKSKKTGIKPKEQKPLLTIKPKKIPEKSDFVKKIISFLEQQDIELLEEVALQKKEFSSIVRINTDLGKNNFLCLAKDKRKISENDLAAALQKAQSLKMPVLLISSGRLDKKAQSYLKEYNNLIKILKL